MQTVLVLGGYGFFGARICAALAQDEGIRLLVGGRDGNKALALASSLGQPADRALAIDANGKDFTERLRGAGVTLLIHTAGPFQGQDYGVARAAIAAGCHYIDLADARDFVAGIESLDAEACRAGVLVSAGASSLPALSSAVVDRYFSRFSRLDSICHGIGSGARAPGPATMRGVFSYCGKPFTRLKEGRWETTHGWLDLTAHRFPSPVGRRYLGSCDVPDLVLFPRRYPSVRTVTFHAGFASTTGHLAVWAGAGLVKANLLPSLVPLVSPLHRISGWMEPLVSDKGGMFVTMKGLDAQGQPLNLTWHLLAARHHGPHIPCGAAIALARKLARGALSVRGALPCMGLLSVEEYLAALDGMAVWEAPPEVAG